MKHGKITEEALAGRVSAFYAKARQDPLIGPIFNGAIEDWDVHLPKLQSLWSSVMLGTGRYKGRPMPAHIRHGDAFSPATFERWLGLWWETTDQLLKDGPAAALQEKANGIAESLSLGAAFHRDRSLGIGNSAIS